MTRIERDKLPARPRVVRSLAPMLIVDGRRRVVQANAAACLFLRLALEEICKLSIDDLTTVRQRPDLDAMWSDFLQDAGSRQDGRTIPWDLRMPDATSVAVDLSGAPHVAPGRHLAIIGFPATRKLDGHLNCTNAPAKHALTRREREILTLVALGHTGLQIAEQLFVAPTTVATHVTNALIKLGAKNRANGIAIAWQSGQLELAGSSRDRLVGETSITAHHRSSRGARASPP